MPLVKTTLESGILALLQKMKQETDPVKAEQDFAKDLATLIDTYIKTGTVTTTVIGTSPGGPVTGTGTGSIS